MVNVQRQQETFATIKKILHQQELKYLFIFTAKLRVVHKEKTHFFVTASEAWTWLVVAAIDIGRKTWGLELST
ncbi:hypothetical protein NDU88_004224, partial [Pleurodeles waltl]